MSKPGDTIKPNNPKLIQIGRLSGKQPASWRDRSVSGPVADKFFALGAAFAVLGTLIYGLYLWLVLNRVLPLEGNYATLRRAHVVVQVFLFFGLFVLGFISQAGSKVVGAKLEFAAKPLVLLPIYVFGGIGMMFTKPWAPWIVCLTFAAYALRMAYVCLRGCDRPIQAMLCILGLSVLAASPFLPLEDQRSALLVTWGGFGSLIFAASVQFIVAFLGGNPLHRGVGTLFIILHCTSILLLLAGSTLNLIYPALMSLLGLAIYLTATNFKGWFSSVRTNPLNLAFVSGYLWSIAAWMIVFFSNYSTPDLTLHILATGWAAPLIFAVSSQVVAFLTSRNTLIHRKLWWFLLMAWQLVPLGRGAFHLFALPEWFSLIVAISSAAVILTWAAAIWRAEWTMLRLQASLQKGESLKSCG
ncbi:MAG: NnrS family protein [Bdellovibrionales bacterium]|nr:NnrS family protein [Bdellovibrionales bacterium]